MAAPPPPAPSLLACCHGYTVVTADGPCGAVETPLFPPDCGEPDFLVLRMGAASPRRFPILPVALVQRVDPEAELVLVAGDCAEIERLPDRLPLAST